MISKSAVSLVSEMKFKFIFEKNYRPDHLKINKDLLQVIKEEIGLLICADSLLGMKIEETEECIVTISFLEHSMTWGITLPVVYEGIQKKFI